MRRWRENQSRSIKLGGKYALMLAGVGELPKYPVTTQLEQLISNVERLVKNISSGSFFWNIQDKRVNDHCVQQTNDKRVHAEGTIREQGKHLQ